MEQKYNIVETGVDEAKFQFTTPTSGNILSSDNFKNLLRVILSGEQELEDAIFSGAALLNTNNSSGVPLDTMGAIVGESRLNINGILVNDDIYIENIATRKALNLASGTWEDFLTACRYLQVNGVISEYSVSSASAMIMNVILYDNLVDMDTTMIDRIKDLFRTVKCAEVQLNLSYTESLEVFGWEADPDVHVRGFGTGSFSHIINV